MPLIVRYPAWIDAGTVNSDMVINADLAPTILNMAGIQAPDDMQGRSFLPNLQGNTPSDWGEAVYYHYWQHILHRDVAGHYGIRTRDRKLIFYYGLSLGYTEYDLTPPEWELFDLEKNPYKMRNVYYESEYQSEIKGLNEEFISLHELYNDRGEEYPEFAGGRREFLLTGLRCH